MNDSPSTGRRSSERRSEVPLLASREAALSDLDLAIVILNYNTVHLLRECLRSVFASETSLRYTVCVVDNASTDGSAEMVAAEFPAVKLIVNPINIGYSAGNNQGLRWFGFGDDTPPDTVQQLPRYVLLLNPDTLIPPTTIEAMVRFMEERPD